MRNGGNLIPRCKPYGRVRHCRTSGAVHFSRHHSVQWGHRIHRAIDGYASGIIRLIGESYGQESVQSAWREFTSGRGQIFCGYEANAELFFSWLFHQWTPARERGDALRDEALYGTAPTRAYLERRSSDINPLLRRYLRACLATSPRFYEILGCTAGLSFRVRDVFTGALCTVSEGLASTSLETGDILYAHLIPIEQVTLMEAISPLSFPPQSKRRLLQISQSRRAHESVGAEFRQLYFKLFAIASR